MNAWQTNVDIQPVVNDYNALASMCQDFTKTKEQCSQTMKQRVTEAFGSTIHHLEAMKIIPKVYLNNRKCSAQKIVYHILLELQSEDSLYILLELKVRKIFLAVYYVNTNLPIKRAQALFSEKELSELPGDSSFISNQIGMFK